MKTAVIAFDEEGIEFTVRLSPVPVAEFFDVSEKRDKARFSDRKSFDALCASFAPLVVSWSLDAEPSAEGLAGIDINVVIALVSHWVSEVASLDLPLRRKSSDGEPSEDPSPES